MRPPRSGCPPPCPILRQPTPELTRRPDQPAISSLMLHAPKSGRGWIGARVSREDAGPPRVQARNLTARPPPRRRNPRIGTSDHTIGRPPRTSRPASRHRGKTTSTDTRHPEHRNSSRSRRQRPPSALHDPRQARHERIARRMRNESDERQLGSSAEPFTSNPTGTLAPTSRTSMPFKAVQTLSADSAREIDLCPSERRLPT